MVPCRGWQQANHQTINEASRGKTNHDTREVDWVAGAAIDKGKRDCARLTHPANLVVHPLFVTILLLLLIFPNLFSLSLFSLFFSSSFPSISLPFLLFPILVLCYCSCLFPCHAVSPIRRAFLYLFFLHTGHCSSPHYQNQAKVCTFVPFVHIVSSDSTQIV